MKAVTEYTPLGESKNASAGTPYVCTCVFLSDSYLVFPRIKNVVLQQPTLTFTFDETQLSSMVYLDKFLLMQYIVSVPDTNTKKKMSLGIWRGG